MYIIIDTHISMNCFSWKKKKDLEKRWITQPIKLILEQCLGHFMCVYKKILIHDSSMWKLSTAWILIRSPHIRYNVQRHKKKELHAEGTHV